MLRTAFAGLLCLSLWGVQVLGGDLPVEPKLKVLVVTGGHGFDRPAFGALFNAVGDITWEEAVYGGNTKSAAAILGGGAWKSYDVVVFYDMIQKVPEKVREGIRSLTEAGKGLVMLHHTLGAHQNWPLYRRIVGGKYYLRPQRVGAVTHPASKYRHGVDFTVHIVDPKHPITWGMEDFRIHDETYKDFEVLPGTAPLLTTKEPSSGPCIGWTHSFGRSRVVYLQLGHDKHAYEHPSYRLLVERAIRYAACRPAVPDRPWRELFDGKSLSGWRAEGKAAWSVQGGLLVGKQGPGNAPGDLFTGEQFSDFEAVVRFRVVWPANSGVWFRYQSARKAYQADILEWKNPRCWTGTLYCPGKMFLAMNTDPKLVRREGWNTLVIRAAGSHLFVFLNGTKVADVFDDTSRKGRFGIQVHPGAQFGPMRIEVSRFQVRPL